MSDTMLLGILRMPFDLAMPTPTAQIQYHQRGVQAADEIEKLRADIDRLTRERDEARYFLKIFVHAHANNNAVPPHIEEQARKALEAKP